MPRTISPSEVVDLITPTRAAPVSGDALSPGDRVRTKSGKLYTVEGRDAQRRVVAAIILGEIGNG